MGEYFIRLKASVIGPEDEGRDRSFIYTLAFALQLKKLMGKEVRVTERYQADFLLSTRQGCYGQSLLTKVSRDFGQPSIGASAIQVAVSPVIQVPGFI